MDLRHAFLGWLKNSGDTPLILEGDTEFSLREIATHTAALAGLLREDSRISGHLGILMPNCRAFIPAFYGSLFAGKIPVPVNPMLPAKELVQMMRIVEANTILTITLMKPLVEKLEAEKSGINIIYLDQLAESLKQAAPAELRRRANPQLLETMAQSEISDVAVMLFSSGTTGLPKAVMLTHANILENIKAIQVSYPFTEKDTAFGLLPFFHSYGLCVLNLTLMVGARFLMVPRFHPAEAFHGIRQRDVTILMLVPEMFKVLAQVDGIRDYDWSRVRLCITGGGPSSAALRTLWKETTGQILYAGYGLTEYSPVVSIGIPGQYKEGSVGKPLPGVSIRILGQNGNDLPAMEEGEVLVKGPSVMKGYYKQTEATDAMVDADGWLHTGDIGFLDDEGFLYISGRAKDIIIVAGENVLPQEIEDALALHPEVVESAVVGIPDDLRGEVPAAFVVPAPNAQTDPSQLKSFLRDRLVSHKIPREIRFVDKLPKTPVGKVLRRELKKMFESAPS